MAPSAPPPELPAAELAGCLELLDEIERRWRDALSFVVAEDAQAAAREIERAGEILSHLGRLDQAAELLSPAALAAFTERMQRLSRLHRELVSASHSAQTSLGRALAQTRTGRAALDAYSPGESVAHACDELV
jgi:hypothetical protein